MKNLILFLKGIIIGIGKIIPGVSGSVLALMLGVYDKGIDALHHIFKKENFIFLSVSGLGILLSIVIGSSSILYLLKKYYFPVMLLFCGLILGTIPIIKKETSLKSKKSKLLFLFIIIFFPLLSICHVNHQYAFTYQIKDFFFFLFAGFIEASTMIIPGISGTALLMLLGVYDLVMESFSHLFSLTYFFSNIQLLLPFFIGFLLGVFLVTRMIHYTLCKYKEKTYCCILAFSISSLFLLIYKTFSYHFSINDLFIGFFLFIIGFFLSLFLSKKQ